MSYDTHKNGIGTVFSSALWQISERAPATEKTMKIIASQIHFDMQSELKRIQHNMLNRMQKKTKKNGACGGANVEITNATAN